MTTPSNQVTTPHGRMTPADWMKNNSADDILLNVCVCVQAVVEKNSGDFKNVTKIEFGYILMLEEKTNVDGKNEKTLYLKISLRFKKGTSSHVCFF